jgi:hypothetical protein
VRFVRRADDPERVFPVEAAPTTPAPLHGDAYAVVGADTAVRVPVADRERYPALYLPHRAVCPCKDDVSEFYRQRAAAQATARKHAAAAVRALPGTKTTEYTLFALGQPARRRRR